MRFILGVIILAVFAAFAAIVMAYAVTLWQETGIFEKVERVVKTDPMEYQRGYERGRHESVLYLMGYLTFPIACSICENINSDKCYRCKEERQSGFKLKEGVLRDDADRENP